MTTAFYLSIGFFISLVVVVLFFLRYQKATRLKNETNLKTIENQNRALAATKELNNIILQTLDFDLLAQRIADAIPEFLGYQTGVLAIVDEQKKVLKRIAISETTGGKAALESLEIPFGTIEISLSDEQNYCIRALKENKVLYTTQLYDVLRPVISEENSKQVQMTMGTKTTLVYPIYSLDKQPLGTFIVSMSKDFNHISDYELETISNFVEGVKIALVNASLFTRLKYASQQLEQANTKLEELDQLKDDFVSVASHELRTPLTAIRSYSWMALHKSDIPLTEKMTRYLSRTLISTERLINLVNEMLNISRIESGRVEIKPEIFNIQALVKDVFEEVSVKAAEKHLHLQMDPTNIPNVFADQDKVHQVLLNLIGNSLKFTPEAGLIEVKFAVNQTVVGIAIQDNGAGISSDDIHRLFKKFGRLANSYVTAGASGGTGLGLFVCKSLVNLMGGEIWVESPGIEKGSTFYFTLPIATEDALAHAERYQIKPDGEAKVLEPVTF